MKLEPIYINYYTSLSNLLQSSHFGLSNHTLGPLKYTDPTGWWNSGGGSDKAQAINDLASKLSRETMDRFEAQHSQAYIHEMLNLNKEPTKEQLYQNLITEFPSIVLNDNLSYRINVTSYKVYDGLGSRTITTPECSDICLSTLRHSEIWPTYTRIYEVQYRSAQGNGGDGKDWFGIGLGGVGAYFDIKGNALHNDFYWKGKTTGKIYTKNPFTSTKVGWKANSFKATGKAFQGAKSLGTKLGVAGLLVTGYDIVLGDGLTTSNMLDATFGAAGFIPGVDWMISGSYFIVNTGVQLYSGKSIGEHWDE